MSVRIDDLIAFVKQAGDMAYAMQRDVVLGTKGTYTKEDNTLVTDADLAVTELFHQTFANYLNHPDHLIIDEETAAKGNGRTAAELEQMHKAKYLWSLDPVDGTVAFAAGSPLWGVSLGIFKDGVPWLGAIYIPAMRELFYSDGEEAFLVTENLSTEPVMLLARGVKALPGDPILHPAMAMEPKQSSKDAGFYAIAPWASVFKYAWLAANRHHGALFSSTTLWDCAAGLAIVKAAGVSMFLNSAPQQDLLQTDMRPLFGDNWRLNESYITCLAADYADVREKYSKAYVF